MRAGAGLHVHSGARRGSSMVELLLYSLFSAPDDEGHLHRVENDEEQQQPVPAPLGQSRRVEIEPAMGRRSRLRGAR